MVRDTPGGDPNGIRGLGEPLLARPRGMAWKLLRSDLEHGGAMIWMD